MKSNGGYLWWWLAIFCLLATGWVIYSLALENSDRLAVWQPANFIALALLAAAGLAVIFFWWDFCWRQRRLARVFRRLAGLEDEAIWLYLTAFGEAPLLTIENDQWRLSAPIYRWAKPEDLAEIMAEFLRIFCFQVEAGRLIFRAGIFDCLAVDLVGHWPERKIVRFVWSLKERKIYLGELLDKALELNRLETQLRVLQQAIAEVNDDSELPQWEERLKQEMILEGLGSCLLSWPRKFCSRLKGFA